MKISVKKSKIDGFFAVPGSKSHTIRGLVGAMLSDGESILDAALISADTMSVFNAVKNFNCRNAIQGTTLKIIGNGGIFPASPQAPDLGNSGTGLRLLSAATALGCGCYTFDGDASLRTRKMAPLLNALEVLGAKCHSNNGFAPISITGPIKGGKCRIDGTTSQFLSALLIAAPLASGDTVIDLDFLNEAPYVEITLNWLKNWGINLKYSSDLLHFEIKGGQKIPPFHYTIPADFSTALFPAAAALMTGGTAEIANLDFNDLQGDKAVFKIFEDMGAEISYGKTVKISGGGQLHGGTFDLNKVPDALPILSALAAGIKGETTRLVNVPQARIKETDRIKCMRLELEKMGAKITELPDGMIIEGTELQGADLLSYDDHRIGMALAIAGMTAETPAVINNIECAGVTYPDFIPDFQKCGADFMVIE